MVYKKPPKRLTSGVLLHCKILSDFCLFDLVAVLGDELEHYQNADHQHSADGQRDHPALREARDDEAYERHARDRQRVWQLGRYMVDVVALSACGGHDGGVGDRRAVVAAYSARETSGDTDDLKLAAREDVEYDRDEDTECTP